MEPQAAFAFDTPLTHDPVSQLAPIAPKPDNEEMTRRLAAVLPDLPDDIDLDAPLLAIGFEKHSLTGWHRSRALDALIGGPAPDFQAYTVSQESNGALKIRYRRLPPLMPCPGYSGFECGKPTRGGVLCTEHRKWEEEDLWVQP